MQNVSASFFLCEDMRWEANGAPMFIGVMSPKLHATEYPVIFPVIHVITMLRASKEVMQLEATLRISGIENEGINEKPYSISFERTEDEDDEWLVISSLPLHDVELKKGDKILFELDFNGNKQNISLKAAEEIEM